MRSQKKEGYAPLCLDSVAEIAAQTRNFEAVAAYLVMSRYANGESIGGSEPHTYTGAGANAIHERVGIAESKATLHLRTLIDGGWISEAPPDIRQAHPVAARYVMNRKKKDALLPHSFVSGLEGVSSALKRIKQSSIPNRYSEKLKGLLPNEARLDAVMLLLSAYEEYSMLIDGGIPIGAFRRLWDVDSKRKGPEGTYTWLASPEGHMQAGFDTEPGYFRRYFGHHGKKIHGERCWAALETLTGQGLLYEAVTLYYRYGEGASSSLHRQCTIRVNDYHADRGEGADPSLMKELGRMAFYTNPASGEPEELRIEMPSDQGELVGVYRPRFRAPTPEVGKWLDDDQQACAVLAEEVLTHHM